MACFSLSFIISSYWLTKWLFLKYSVPECAAKLWRSLGKFLAILLLDSVAGTTFASANAIIFGSFISLTNAPKTAVEAASYSLLATNAPLRGLAAMLRGVEFVCLSCSSLMVLRRLMDHSMLDATQREQAQQQQQEQQQQEQHQQHHQQQHHRRHWAATFLTATMVLSSLCSLCSLASACAHALFLNRMGAIARSVSSDEACNYDKPAYESQQCNALLSEKLTLILPLNERSGSALASQNISETIGLILIAAMYIYLAPLCIAILRNARAQLNWARRNVNSNKKTNVVAKSGDGALAHVSAPSKMQEMVDLSLAAVRSQGKRLVTCYSVVLATFIPRVVLNCMYAFASVDFTTEIEIATELSNQTSTPSSKSSCAMCGVCQSLGTLIYRWLSHNPSIIACAVSFSSPIALCVCLLLMMSPSERQLLMSRALQASIGVEAAAGLLNKRLKIDLSSEQDEQGL